MVRQFQSKIISSNVKLKLISITFVIALSANGQQHSKKDAETKKEEIQARQETESEEKRQAFLKHQLAIQSKNTQKRMIENQQMTEDYYRNRYHKSIFQILFPKKRKLKNKLKK